jgi:hypothetical protein
MTGSIPEKRLARLATLAELREHLLPLFIQPVPSDETLRVWFEEANIPTFKANPRAKRGGGPVYYGTAAIEKLLRRKLEGIQ